MRTGKRKNAMKDNRLHIIALLLTAIVLMSSACEKEVRPDPASDKTLQSLKCYVYYDLDSWSVKQELDVLSGTYNAEKGAIVYTFPNDPQKYNAQSLERCRLEASIPATARLVEVGADGNVIGDGIGGLRSLAGTSSAGKTVRFKIIAADGSEKSYQATFKMN